MRKRPISSCTPLPTILAEEQTTTHVEQLMALNLAAATVLASISCEQCRRASLAQFLRAVSDLFHQIDEQMELAGQA